MSDNWSLLSLTDNWSLLLLATGLLLSRTDNWSFLFQFLFCKAIKDLEKGQQLHTTTARRLDHVFVLCFDHIYIVYLP